MQLAPPESVPDQRARLKREAEQAETQARQQDQRERLLERAARPLTGSRGDLGQLDLLGGGDLFSQPG